MKLFAIRLFSDMRVIVIKIRGQWEVWPQTFKDGKWSNHNGPCTARKKLRGDAMLVALQLSDRIVRQFCDLEVKPQTSGRSTPDR